MKSEDANSVYTSKPPEGPVDARQSHVQWLSQIASRWRSPVAVTLTLKQAAITPTGGLAKITVEDCRRTAARFGRALDRIFYGRAARRHGLKLNKIFVLEQSHGGRWHYHAMIEPPEGVTAAEFERAVRDCWKDTEWGYDQVHVEPNADAGWLTYILKPVTKDGLDHWADGVELVTK